VGEKDQGRAEYPEVLGSQALAAGEARGAAAPVPRPWSSIRGKRKRERRRLAHLPEREREREGWK
jgi:hypothetical protein